MFNLNNLKSVLPESELTNSYDNTFAQPPNICCKTGLILAIFLISLLISTSSYPFELCNADQIYEEYYNKFYKCDELVENTRSMANDCLKDMDKDATEKMAILLLQCGYPEEVLPYLAGQRQYKPRNYNFLLWMESLLISDEEAMMKISLKPINYRWSESTKQLLRAHSYANYGDFNNAAKILEAALKRKPENLEFADTIQEIYMEAGNFEKASFYAGYLNNIDPESISSYLTYAYISYYKGDYDDAWKNLMEAREHSESAGDFIEAILHITNGDYDKAIDPLENYISHTPYVNLFSEHIFELDFANTYIDLYHDEGKIPKADELLTRAMRLYDEEDYLGGGECITIY